MIIKSKIRKNNYSLIYNNQNKTKEWYERCPNKKNRGVLCLLIGKSLYWMSSMSCYIIKNY